ncbi:MAG: hypothetical protein JXB19_09470 [Bacteroidales bacterium]|nr:hypothetical protein [Bacteroidales bacterium]
MEGLILQLSKFLKSPFTVILITAILAYWPVAFFVYTFKWDMLDVVFPFRYFAGECLPNGILPLWNPYQLTGSPVYADLQYPLWSPEVWFVGLTTGYNIYILHILFIFYIFLAGYGMYRLVHHFTGHRLSAVVTGISYMLSGFFVGHGQALFAIIGASFLPWIVDFMNAQPEDFPVPDQTGIIENSDMNLTYDPLWRNMGILTKRISYDGFSSFILDPYNYLYDSLPRLKDSLLMNPFVYLSGNVQKASNLAKTDIVFHRNDIYLPDSIFYALPPVLKKNLSEASVEITSFSPVKFRIRYHSDTASIITVMQMNHPGWLVKIDNYETPHFTSNFLYISAVAPPGSHEVLFEYHNKVVVICFVISCTSLFVVIMLIMYLHFKNYSVFKDGAFHI